MKLLVIITSVLLCIQIHFASSGVLEDIGDKISKEFHAKHNRTKALKGDLDLGFVKISGDVTVNKETGIDKESSDGNTNLDFEHKKKVKVNLQIHGKPQIHNLLHPDDKREYNKTIELASNRTTSLHLGSKVGKVIHDLAEKVSSAVNKDIDS